MEHPIERTRERNLVQERRRRPTGVSVMSFALVIQAIVELAIAGIAIFGLAAVSHAIKAHGHTSIGTVIDIFGWILGIIPLVLGIVTLLLAIGLWTLQRWAFWATIFISALFLLRQIIEFIKPHDSVVLIILGMIIPVAILLYMLVNPRVRHAFHIGT